MGSNKIVAGGGHCMMTSTFIFFLVSFTFLGSIAAIYAWLILTPSVRTILPSLGCREDNEGSWSIGVFFGDSPFSLKPIENINIWKEEAAAWPVANPIITCASLSAAGFPSNFVADPFLYAKGDELYVFFETKNTITMQGDIAVAKSTDKGATWQPLGIALDEEWHVSYPYVFAYNNQIYMMPEGSTKGDLRLYRAVEFPLRWKLERVVMKRPLVDSSIVEHEGKYWLFGSDHSGIGTKKNGHLGIWYSDHPIGPWRPHKNNPIYNTDKSMGARNGGRPFTHEGKLYRLGQDCGETYGKRIRLFRVDVLTTDEYKEMEVPFDMIMTSKGRNAWNGARYHHLDVQKLPSGEWIGIADGDRVPSGDSVRRFVLGYSSLVGLVFVVVFMGVLFGVVKCVVPLSWCPHSMEKRSDSLLDLEKSRFYSSRVRKLCTRFNRAISFMQSRIRLNSCSGMFVVVVLFLLGVLLSINSTILIYGRSGSEEPYLLNGLYSEFTMLTMTYDARLWNLKLFVKHYSRCSSVKEIVVVWNKGIPPKPSEFDSVVPVRIRIEERNSLNNRFKIDKEIKTRAVLELDDDIMMLCSDIERGFKVWREHPERIVGFYPRLIDGSTRLKYRGEKHARSGRGYNMILTGAAFIDAQMAFERYWSEEAKVGRQLVDKNFNCEDILLNYLFANSSKSPTVEYVRPTWTLDMSKLSSVAISRNTDEHYRVRSNCLERFAELYGSLSSRKSEFDGRKDGWDL